ncbi:COX15/CtaA family protein [Neptuniibacter sp. PT8_73]|uniref:COX15/CtaA family protein n=1 Tax=unclassified Neptuniibacter TaxID=2630693 RepID=UPI0039F6CD2C
MLKLIWRLSNVAIVLALCVVFLGAWTRINHAGLSCPDWPGCYGYMVMPTDQTALTEAQDIYPDTPIELGKTALEMGHRYLAGSLGLVIAALAFCAYKLRRVQTYPVYLSYGLLLLVTVQAVFGMWTVTLKLYPPVVTLHLLGGVLTLTGVYVLRSKVNTLMAGVKKQKTKCSKWIKYTLAVLLLQIVLGGWTSSNYAGPACGHWLSCSMGENTSSDFTRGFNLTETIGPNYQGGLLPLDARVAIQQGHRIGALVVLIVCTWLVVKLHRQIYMRSWLYGLLALLSIQIFLGGLNAIYAVPDLLAIGHHAVAVGLLLVLLKIYELRLRTVEVNHG